MICGCKNSVLANFISSAKQKDIAKLNQEFIDDMLILICDYLQSVKQKEEEYENLEFLRNRLNKHIHKFKKIGLEDKEIVEYLKLYI
jgi:hypothetical protein